MSTTQPAAITCAITWTRVHTEGRLAGLFTDEKVRGLDLRNVPAFIRGTLAKYPSDTNFTVWNSANGEVIPVGVSFNREGRAVVMFVPSR
jgi:hypothetical protein